MNTDERLAVVEEAVGTLKHEHRAIQTTLHELIRTALVNHEAAIARLSAAHDARLGVWWTLLWVGAGLTVIVGAVAWLLEHQISIVIKP